MNEPGTEGRAKIRAPLRMAPSPLDRLEERIGYRFRKKSLLTEALTHSSYVQEYQRRERDNEVMEFLGDAVLNLSVTLRLVESLPGHDEGKLSLARAGLVSASHLGQLAAALDLGSYLRLGSAEERTGGRKKSGI